jgi:hypothetical protein
MCIAMGVAEEKLHNLKFSRFGDFCLNGAVLIIKGILILGKDGKMDYLTTRFKYDVHVLPCGEYVEVERESRDFEGKLSGFLKNCEVVV